MSPAIIAKIFMMIILMQRFVLQYWYFLVGFRNLKNCKKRHEFLKFESNKQILQNISKKFARIYERNWKLHDVFTLLWQLRCQYKTTFHSWLMKLWWSFSHNIANGDAVNSKIWTVKYSSRAALRIWMFFLIIG